jgi:hypothetical protein
MRAHHEKVSVERPSGVDDGGKNRSAPDFDGRGHLAAPNWRDRRIARAIASSERGEKSVAQRILFI